MARPASAALVAAVLLLLVLVVAGLPTGASASGVASGARIATERVLLSLQDGREELVLGLDLAEPGAGPARRSAILVPVPATPTVRALPAAQAGIFDELQLATRGQADPATTEGDETGALAPPRGPGPSVLSRERVGGYDVTRLPAGDLGALRAWVDRTGFETPEAAQPVLEDYARRGWAFVAIRLAEPVRGDDATLSPLRIAFPAERPIYPLRLSALRLSAKAAGPVAVDLYVAGEHRVIAPGFDTYFAGGVAALRPALPAAVRPLVRGPFLTRLGLASDEPAAITSDVRPRTAVSDRLFRASTGYPYETLENFALGPLPSDLPGQGDDAPLTDAPGGAAWLLLFPAIGLSVGVVFVLLRLRERFRRRA